MDSVEKAIESAEKALGINFIDKNLLRVALTHSSFAYEHGSGDFNEKLEFLGDSVLGVVVTEFIYKHYPEHQEGGLAKLRANLIRAETLAEVGRDLSIGDYVLIGKGAEQSGGRTNISIIADCLEAVIGAIYLDQDYETTKKIVIKLFYDRIIEQGKLKELGDPKTTLQEITMEKWSTLPDYALVKQEGPAHKPMFSAAVSVKGKVLGHGVGPSKKQAQQLAAKEALEEIAKQES
ncbi:MAG TPA: ribonuclease III [Actinobacteria bacterium]|nr:ribonuclease III [Actinomycetota bacterium]